jgi:molecular chaperone DnaJ
VPKDFYSILGVARTASETEIKQAYRKLSRELHPDKHKGDKEKEAKFKEVNEAYDILSDPKKKQAYDQFGSTNGNPFHGGGSGFGGFGGFDPSSFQGTDFSDLFESFFGGAGGRRKRTTDTRGRSLETEIVVSFSDAVLGTERDLQMKTFVRCGECKGSGSSEGTKLVSCEPCGGTGSVQRTQSSLFGMIRQSVLCEACGGSGKIPERPCKRCNGEGRLQEHRTVKVRVPKGIEDGQSLRMTEEGEAGRRGGESGDLLIRVRVQNDPRFERDGDDIRSSVKVPLLDAVLGGRIAVETVHGPTEISIAAGTQPGQVLRIKGKGMPVLNTSRFGDHYVTADIEVPTKLSRAEKELFEKLRESSK